MKTSNFFVYKGGSGISIARSTPRGWTGATYWKLAPPWKLIADYKQDGDKAKYTEGYYKLVLDKLDPNEVYAELKDKVLLCWESPGDFCHRRLVAEWLEKNLSIEVPEL